jgi:sarcosine oxidase, subunit gamma
MTPLRRSPLHEVTLALGAKLTDRDGMTTPFLFDANDRERMSTLGIIDLSFLSRCGLKGPNSVEWLRAQGLQVPDVNTWVPIPSGGLVARLGNTEFLIEDCTAGTKVQQLATALATLPARVYPVLRQDASLALTGTLLHSLLRQTCNLDFKTLNRKTRQLALTSMVGVPVIISPGDMAGQACYRVWCDGTFGSYLWQTLHNIARELGGGAVGIGCFVPEAFQLINS